MKPMVRSTTTPRDAERTRNLLLCAAQKLFAERGYTTTGVREIASLAGVNSALVRRYFGSKHGLLRAAVEGQMQVEIFTDGPRETFGERAIATLMQTEVSHNPTAMMMLATADPAARILCSDLMHQHIVVPLSKWLGGPEALIRAARLNMLWMGFMTARSLLPVPALDDREGSTHRWLADLCQRIADGEAR